MSFLKFDFSRLSPSPSKSKGRSALSTTSLIKQTEQDLKLNLEKSKYITPFGHYKNCSMGDTFNLDYSKDYLSTQDFKKLDKNEKSAIEILIHEIFNKCFDEYKAKLIDEIMNYQGNYFVQMKDFNNMKSEINAKYADISKKMEELNLLISKKGEVMVTAKTVDKEYQKCLSYRSDYIDNDIEENPTENLNEIKFIEKNMNNLRWKDSTQKSDLIINSKKNSNVWDNHNNNVDLNNIMEELNKIKVKIEGLEMNHVKNEAMINDGYLENPLQLRLASSIKNKKQESLEACHQQTPSFDQTNDFKFSIANNVSNHNSAQKPTKKYETYEPIGNINPNEDSVDLCITDFPSKFQAELIKNESGNTNNDYSPNLSENQHVETFHEKYLIDKIALENPLSDDYLKKKKSIIGIQDEDIRLRSSYGRKSIDDIDVAYEKEGFVPIFNFYSNKSQFASQNSKINKGNNISELDNDIVELGTNETKSNNEIDECMMTGKFVQFEEKENCFKKDKKSEIKEADSKEEFDDNDVIIYHLDENNYLMDEKGGYIFDEEHKQMRISVENLEYLRKSYAIENN